VTRCTITVDLLMSTRPPASSMDDVSSWVALAESCRRRKWRAPTPADLCLTACRYAAAHHRADVLTPWVQEVTRQRVVAQRKRHGAAATPEVLAIWTALEAWDGSAEQARALRGRADVEWWSRRWSAADASYAYADAAAAAVYAVYAYAYADAYYAYAYDAADADWQLLLSLCQRLDAAMGGRP
jgi:hypothetical protein